MKRNMHVRMIQKRFAASAALTLTRDISPIRQLDDNEGDLMKDDKKSDLLFGFRF